MYEDDRDDLDYSSFDAPAQVTPDMDYSAFDDNTPSEPDYSVFDDQRSPYEMKMDESEDDGQFWSDFGSLTMQGGAQLALGVSWLLDITGFDGAADGLHSVASNAIDYWDEKVSDETKAGMREDFVTVAKGGKWYNPFDWERGEAGLKEVAMHGAQSLIGTAAGMGLGAGATKALGWVIGKYANPLGIEALTTAAEKGARLAAQGASKADDFVLAGKRAEKYLSFIDKATGAAGFGLGEGAIGGAMTGASVRDQIMAMPHEQLMERSSKYREYFEATDTGTLDDRGYTPTPMAERIELAKSYIADQASSKAGFQAGLTTAVLGAPMGAAWERVLGPTRVGKQFAAGKLAGFVKGGLGEAVQEAGQSASEQAITNFQIREYADELQKLGEGVFKAAVGGAAAGGGMGAVFGLSQRTNAQATRADQSASEKKHNAELQTNTDEVIAQVGITGQALIDNFGHTGASAAELLDPIAQQYAEDENFVSAISDLRYIAERGEPRAKEYDTEEPQQPVETAPEDMLHGWMDVEVENEVGSIREHADGETVMRDTYGRLRGTTGADGDGIDVFMGADAENPDLSGYVIHQNNKDGSFDEHKVMVGYASQEAAQEAYYRNYDNEYDRIGQIDEMSLEELQAWTVEQTELNTKQGGAEDRVTRLEQTEKKKVDETQLKPAFDDGSGTPPPVGQKVLKEVKPEVAEAVADTTKPKPAKAKTGTAKEVSEKTKAGDKVTVYNTAGKPVEAEYLETSERGTVAVSVKGKREILGMSLSQASPEAEDATVRFGGKETAVKSLGDKQLKSLSSRLRNNLKKLIKVKQEGGGQGLVMQRSITSVKAEQARRQQAEKPTPRYSLSRADYQGEGAHTAPERNNYNAPLHELTKLYPDDVYGPNAVQYYGHGGGQADRLMDAAAVRVAKKVRNNPDAEVTVYRAVPAGKDAVINAGDWVTTVRAYAEQHSRYFTKGEVITVKAKASELYTDANSMLEYGYQPEAGDVNEPSREKTAKPTPRYSLAKTPEGVAENLKPARGKAKYITLQTFKRRYNEAQRQKMVDAVGPQIELRVGGKTLAGIEYESLNEQQKYAAFIKALDSAVSISPQERARRQKTSERMQALNKERSDTKRVTASLFAAPTSSVRGETDSSVAGANSEDEAQEAMVEWARKGVGSKYFKRWFGKSKAMDKWGQPIVFFHSTAADFTEFKHGRRGAFFFSPSPEFASRYGEREGQRLMPVYIRANKIFDYKNRKMVRSLKRHLAKSNDRAAVARAITQVKTGDWAIVESKLLQDFLRDRNYDAFWAVESGVRNLGVFKATNIKSAVGNVGTFNQSNPDIRYSLSAPTAPDQVFYSALERWVREKMNPTVPKLDLIKNLTDPSGAGLASRGIKQEEVTDTGLIEWLESVVGDTISKTDMYEFVRQQRVEFVEVERRDLRMGISSDKAQISVENANKQIADVERLIKDTLMGAGISSHESENIMGDVKSLGLDALTEHLNDNIKLSEIKHLTNLANQDLWQAELMHAQLTNMTGVERFNPDQNKDRINDPLREPLDRQREPYTLTQRYVPTFREFLMKLPVPKDSATYTSHHWGDKNVLVHMRMWGQFDPETGSRTLIIEEVQSDLHQQGGKYGYGKEQTPEGVVPDFPMKENWKLLGVKRMLRYAAENGYNTIAWVGGETQRDRYNPANDLSGIRLQRVGEKFTGELTFHSGRTQQIPLWNRQEIAAKATGEGLFDRLMEKMGDGNTAALDANEISWSGDHLITFYDKRLRNLVDKYIKRWKDDQGKKLKMAPKNHNIVVGKANPRSKVIPLWTLQIPSQMRADVLKGQPLYSLSNGVGAEFNRRLELYQIIHYLQSNTTEGIKPRVLLRRLTDGMERGFFSKEALYNSGALDRGMLSDRNKMLTRVRERVRGPYINERSSMTKTVVEQELKKITDGWKNAPDYRVHDTWETLPEHIAAHIALHGFQDRAEGTIDTTDGTIHIVASNIHTAQNLHRVFIEESLGHWGLRNFFDGENETEFRDFIYDVMPSVRDSDGWNNLLKTYTYLADDLKSGDPKKVTLAEEAIVEELLAKLDVDQGVWDKFVAWVREWLRKRGLITNYTDNDLKAVMGRVHSGVINGRTPHPWGKRNNIAMVQVGTQVYSLYGGLLESSLEGVLQKLDNKGKPAVYLNFLRGENTEDRLNWEGHNKVSRNAASNKGFKEAELEATGVVDWLIDHHNTEPNISVTSEQILKIYQDTKPKVMAVSRGGWYLFPTPPIRSLVNVGVVNKESSFDEGVAGKELGYFSNHLRSAMSDPELLTEIMGMNSLYSAEELRLRLSPLRLWATGALREPFGNELPTMTEYSRAGKTHADISAELGMENIEKTISYSNSTPQMRTEISHKLIAHYNRKGVAFREHRIKFPVRLEGTSQRSALGEFEFGYSTDINGTIDTIWDASNRSDFRYPELVGRMNKVLADHMLKTAEVAKVKAAGLVAPYHEPAGAPETTTAEDIQGLLERTASRYVQEVVENISDKAALSSPHEIFDGYPRLGEKLADALSGSVSESRQTGFGEGSPSAAYNSSLHAGYTLSGGKSLDVISIQLYNNKAGVNPSSGHYSAYDVVHVRAKDREAVEGKVFAIEEVQSDWTTSFRKSKRNVASLKAFGEKHGDNLTEIYNWLKAEHGYSWGQLEFLAEDNNGHYLRNDISEDSYGRLSNSSLFSTPLLAMVAEKSPEKHQILLAAGREIGDVERSYVTNPWINSYYKLALSSIVAYARENDYVAVAWPEGGQVAQLYGGDMGKLVSTLMIDMNTLALMGARVNVVGGVVEDYAAQIKENAIAGQYQLYNVDYLQGVIKDGGENAIIAKRTWDAVMKYMLSKDDDAMLGAVKDDPNLHYDPDAKRLFVGLAKLHVYNARLHKLLYNTMMNQAGKEIAKDTKAMKKAGERSVRKIFIPDAYNSQVRGSRNEDTSDDAGSVIQHGGEEDFFDEDLDELSEASTAYSADVGYRLMREAQMFGYEGFNARRAIQGFWFDESDKEEHNAMFQHYIDEAPPINDADGNALSIGGYMEQNNVLGEGSDVAETEATVSYIQTYWAKDMDNVPPWNGTITLEIDGSGETLTIPWAGGRRSALTGHGRFFVQGIYDTIPPALFYRYAYEVMSKVWGIRRPVPFYLPLNQLRKLYAGYVTAMNSATSEDDGAQEQMYAAKNASTQGFVDDAMQVGDTREPGVFDLDSTAEAPEELVSLALDIGITDRPALDWLKEHATIKTTLDAYLVKSFLMEKQDSETIAEIDALLAVNPDQGDLLEGGAQTLELPPASTIRAAIPTKYRGNMSMEEDDNKPKYDVDNPEFEEQVWHAIFMNERVKGRPIKVPYSLRTPRGNDDEMSIISNKITKPYSDWTVLDRVTQWVSVLRDRIATGDVLWSMKQGALDSGASIERWEREVFGRVLDASKSPHKMLNLTRNLPSVMAAISKAGIPEMVDGAFQPVDGRKGFSEILRPLYEHPEGDLVRLWEGYAAARRSKDLLEQKNPDGTLREKLFKPEEVVRLLALGEKYPIFKTVFSDWQSFNTDLLTLAESRGVITSKQREVYAANDYVPFFRATEEIEGVDQRTGYGKIKSGVEGQHHGIKRLRGSENPLGNIIENMWFNTASMIDKIYKNEAMTRIVDMLEGVALKRIKIPFEAIRVTNGELANALGRAGLMAGDHKTVAAYAQNQKMVQSGDHITNAGWLAAVEMMTPEQKMQWSVVFRASKPMAPNIVSNMRNGKLEYFEVEDKMLLSTLQGMHAEGLVGLMNAMGFTKSILTKMITVDPGFMLANWLRDTGSAWVTSDANYIPVVDSIGAMADIWGEKGAFIQMMMSGAGGGGFYDLTGGSVSKALKDDISKGASSWGPKAWRGYMKFGAMSENSNRIAIAKRVLKQGGTVAEAMHQAQDIMNFTMSGDYAAMQFLVRTVPFLNARVQGLYRMYRGARDNPIGFILKGMALTSATLALLAHNRDDDDYERLEEWQKDLNWSFFKDGMLYTIPKPFEVGLIFGTLPERFVSNMTGHDDFSVSKDRFWAALGETLAFNPIPQLFKPIYELTANKNLFTGNPIENMAMQGLEPPYRASPWTSEVAKRIGKGVPEALGAARSPLMIQHAIRAYTGTVGLYALNTADWAVRELVGSDLPERPTKKWYEKPVLSRIIKGEAQSSRHNKYTQRLYALIDESNKAFRTINSEVKSFRVEGAKELMEDRRDILAARPMLNEVNKHMREISAQQRAVQNHPTMGADEKRERLDALNRKRNDLLSKAAPMLDKLRVE